MKTLELNEYGVMEIDSMEMVETDGGFVLVSMLAVWGVKEINQAYKEFIHGYETCKCHLNKK